MLEGVENWTKVGNCKITVELLDTNAMIEGKVASLRAALKEVRAAAHAKSVEIEGQIQQLLAIEFNPSQGA